MADGRAAQAVGVGAHETGRLVEDAVQAGRRRWLGGGGGLEAACGPEEVEESGAHSGGWGGFGGWCSRVGFIGR